MKNSNSGLTPLAPACSTFAQRLFNACSTFPRRQHINCGRRFLRQSRVSRDPPAAPCDSTNSASTHVLHGPALRYKALHCHFFLFPFPQNLISPHLLHLAAPATSHHIRNFSSIPDNTAPLFTFLVPSHPSPAFSNMALPPGRRLSPDSEARLNRVQMVRTSGHLVIFLLMTCLPVP